MPAKTLFLSFPSLSTPNAFVLVAAASPTITAASIAFVTIMGNPQEANMSAPPAYAPAFNSTQGGAPALGVTTYSPLASGLTSGLNASSTQPTVSQSQSQSQPLIPQDTPGSGPNSPQQPSFFQPTNNTGTLGGGGVQQPLPQAPQSMNNAVTTPSPTFQPNHGTVNGTISGQQQGQYQPQSQGTDFNPYYPPAQGHPSPPAPPPMYSAPGQPIQFQVVSPLHVLGPGPGAVQCPNCGTRGITNIRHESGSTTQ
ncbi:hypothetical protein CC1G_02828 [Coprinopsis cinerea okayama7|uniref:LITAF domain-containing protein n=1 Tax=Coprinopsis cinerea (strain Okayama-7 / 130 / ATCC MYA-4618 / FGSC 9003) TaxID=240176 RepID=A8N059_COPC7|nr:hypothetical protein CC1G_02828 [Coprinopsis cinerea okayama7\|eukprot:XP_001828247.1 hypothetical protein CC1G_02828 [Coprinopsis cinerea okayama7\